MWEAASDWCCFFCWLLSFLLPPTPPGLNVNQFPLGFSFLRAANTHCLSKKHPDPDTKRRKRNNKNDWKPPLKLWDYRLPQIKWSITHEGKWGCQVRSYICSTSVTFTADESQTDVNDYITAWLHYASQPVHPENQLDVRFKKYAIFSKTIHQLQLKPIKLVEKHAYPLMPAEALKPITDRLGDCFDTHPGRNSP